MDVLTVDFTGRHGNPQLPVRYSTRTSSHERAVPEGAARPRSEQSNTLAVSRVLLESLAEQDPEIVIDELDVFTTDLPDLGRTSTDGQGSADPLIGALGASRPGHSP